MRRMLCVITLSAATGGGVFPATAQEPSRASVVDLHPLPGVVTRILEIGARGVPAPRATLVMVPGGDGEIGIGEDGGIAHGGNFLLRTREAWADRGFKVVIPDAPRGRTPGEPRSKGAWLAALEAVVGRERTAGDAPVWLVSTSRGAIVAAALATAPGGAGVAGVVLASTVTRGGDDPETVFDVDLSLVSVPVLAVTDGDDTCPTSPPEDMARLLAALTGAPLRDTMRFGGGRAAVGRPCGGMSPHGYLGIESRVVAAIGDWILARSVMRTEAGRPSRR